MQAPSSKVDLEKVVVEMDTMAEADLQELTTTMPDIRMAELAVVDSCLLNALDNASY